MSNLREMFAAGIGGAGATAVDMTMLVLGVHHGMPVAPAAFIGAAAGAATGFALNKYVAFRDRTPVTLPQLGRFGFVAVATALLMALAMNIVSVDFGVPYIIAKLACAVAVFAVWTYPAQRRLVFVRANTAPPSWPVEVESDVDASAA